MTGLLKPGIGFSFGPHLPLCLFPLAAWWRSVPTIFYFRVSCKWVSWSFQISLETCCSRLLWALQSQSSLCYAPLNTPARLLIAGVVLQYEEWSLANLHVLKTVFFAGKSPLYPYLETHGALLGPYISLRLTLDADCWHPSVLTPLPEGSFHEGSPGSPPLSVLTQSKMRWDIATPVALILLWTISPVMIPINLERPCLAQHPKLRRTWAGIQDSSSHCELPDLKKWF